jgi:predicted ArsR family transcriptional regulator
VGPGQARVLDVLRSSGGPATVEGLEELTGLGASTLRGHLGALTDAGHLTRLPIRTGRRGRPQWAYVAREPEHTALVRTLADALAYATAGSAASTPPDEPRMTPQAVRAGRSWGQRVVSDLGDLCDPDASAASKVEVALTHAGFRHERDGKDIRITHCPLRDLAIDHRESVCAAHLGMLQGVLGDADQVGLTPFDRDGGCLVAIA